MVFFIRVFLTSFLFHKQINSHFSLFKKTEMTIEKLQKVATAAVEPRFKARWLHWWNSGSILRASFRFPVADVKESILDTWLNRATFWAQVLPPLFIYIHSCHFILLFCFCQCHSKSNFLFLCPYIARGNIYCAF